MYNDIPFDIVDFYTNLKYKQVFLHEKPLQKWEVVELIRAGHCSVTDVYGEFKGFRVFPKAKK